MINKIFIFFLIKYFVLEIKNQLHLLLSKFKFYENHNFLNYFEHKVLNKKLLFKNKNINKFLKEYSNYQARKNRKFKKKQNFS